MQEQRSVIELRSTEPPTYAELADSMNLVRVMLRR